MMKTKTSTKKGHALSIRKYAGLLTLIGLFFALILVLALVTYFSTQRFERVANTQKVMLQQSVITQRLTQSLLNINLYGATELAVDVKNQAESQSELEQTNVQQIPFDKLPQAALYRISDIEKARVVFNETLVALRQGGSVTMLDGSKVVLEPITDEEILISLHQIEQIWTPYEGLLANFSKGVQNQILDKNISDYLVDYTRLYNQPLQAELNSITDKLNETTSYNANILRIIQVVGVLISIIIFTLIVFGSLRQLLNNDRKLSIANQEMSEIMSSVNEGLFLVDKNLTIGGQYSARLEEVIGKKDLANKDLLGVLSSLVPKEDLDTTKVFIDQLYSDWVVEDLIDDLNPLRRVSTQDENGSLKFLDFKFFRVVVNDKIERVLVSVDDTTETVMLQASLDAQKEQEGRELEMLNIILNTNPTLLNGFIKNSLKRLDDINQVLKSPESNKVELRVKAQYIAREIHTVKGEASSLKLHRMVNICETFEESLAAIRDLPNLSGQDFLGLVVLLDDLYRLFDVLEGYGARLGTGSNAVAGINEPEQSPEQAARKFAQVQENYLKQFVADIAARCDKKVQLTVSGFDTRVITEQQWDRLKEIAIQLLRNAVVHGVELPEIRRQRNKSETGSLKLSLSEQPDGNLLLVSEDDGNGIDFNAIRTKAVALGLVSEQDAANLDQRQMLNLMFSNGFSTATAETEDAGRGVGMDIIKETVQGMGGRISVATAAEGYTRFSLIFPKSK